MLRNRMYSCYLMSSLFAQAKKNRTYYQILGVTNQASPKQIRSIFLKKARQLHPDHNTDSEALQQFKLLKQAYEVLKDPQRRYMYDTGISSDIPSADSPAYPQYNSPGRINRKYYENKWYNYKKNEHSDQRNQYYQQQQQLRQENYSQWAQGGLYYRIAAFSLMIVGYLGYDYLSTYESRSDYERQHARAVLQGRTTLQSTEDEKQKARKQRRAKLMNRYIENRAKVHTVNQ